VTKAGLFGIALLVGTLAMAVVLTWSWEGPGVAILLVVGMALAAFMGVCWGSDAR
jgi:hypothetical protein